MSAFSGEEVCSQMVVPNQDWSDVLRQFEQPLFRMGIPYPEIRAIRLQTTNGEEIDLEDVMEADVDLTHAQKRQRTQEP